MTIMFQLISFQLVFFLQAYASFYLVFHKGGENSYFIFQLVFGLPLIFTPILYDEKKTIKKMNIDFNLVSSILIGTHPSYTYICFNLCSMISQMVVLQNQA